MILGSHNTMTYLPPKHWWLYLIRFTAKCQKLSVTEQYDAGVRWFDFRITFKKGKDGLYHNPTFAHGLIDYKSPDLLNILDWLNNQLDDVYVRIIHEKGDDMSKFLFHLYFTKVIQKYTHIHFTASYNKKGWELLYDTKVQCPLPVIERYASNNRADKRPKWKGILSVKNISGWICDDLWPWIYAKFHNKKHINQYKDQDVFLVIDFIKNNGRY